MNLLRSAEALLYEIVSWLIFYPLTFWRCVTHPVRMMIYAERELTDPPEEQFVDTLSPPLFLFLTLVLAHLFQMNVGVLQPELGGVLSDDRNLLLFRAVVFSLLPLLVGIQRVHQKNQKLTRSTLRPAFYSQCYLAAPFALSFDIALVIGQLDHPLSNPIAWTLFLTGLIWYLGALSGWFAIHGPMSRLRGLLQAIGTVLLGACIALAVLIPVASVTVVQP
ncbi:MFS transporter permease [Rhizobium sp. EC-SD404]|uniref:MFS transporter permease n=1 Tax=Rhizobium sp. EC-SD404 TaxID=2038389 RepID=UPI00125F82B4|nr:MFS transporter permease [Rhizobium sp. EC-SD404]